MPLRTRSVAVLLAVLVGPPALADDSENLDRLRSFPPERRAQLAGSLAAFEALPPDEKAAIRDLDARIAALPDEETRAQYLDVLRRYSLWRRTLSEADRKRLDDAPAERRVVLVNEIRREQLAKVRQDIAKADWIQVSSLNDLTLFWTAVHLKIWFELSEEQRDELNKLPDRDDRIRRLQELGRQHKVLQRFPQLRQEFLEELGKAAVSREDKDLKAARAIGAAKKNFGPKPNPITRKAELSLLRDHKAEPVDSGRLEQFEEDGPGWLRESLEPLPPDAARRRLVFLYRLVFPSPSEIPPRKSHAPASKPSAPVGGPGSP